MVEGEAPARPMKYPYTFTAKIAQFPFKFHWEKSPVFKYWFIGIALCTPIFYKIQKLSYNPANVEIWRQKRMNMFYPKEHHYASENY